MGDFWYPPYFINLTPVSKRIDQNNFSFGILFCIVFLNHRYLIHLESLFLVTLGQGIVKYVFYRDVLRFRVSLKVHYDINALRSDTFTKIIMSSVFTHLIRLVWPLFLSQDLISPCDPLWKFHFEKNAFKVYHPMCRFGMKRGVTDVKELTVWAVNK